MDRYSILCVDDDPDVLRSIGRILTEAGHECLMATRASEAHRLIAAHRVSVALCDIGLPGESGQKLAQHRGIEGGRGRYHFQSHDALESLPLSVNGRDDVRREARH